MVFSFIIVLIILIYCKCLRRGYVWGSDNVAVRPDNPYNLDHYLPTKIIKIIRIIRYKPTTMTQQSDPNQITVYGLFSN